MSESKGLGARRFTRAVSRRLSIRSLSGVPAHQQWDYPTWLQERHEQRARDVVQAPSGLFSILTCIYERSPAELFRETAASVLGQQSRHFEWVIVAQGRLPDQLWSALSETAADSRVRCLLKPDNVGIMRGLRSALEAATGRYVLPLDGDDRLHADALGVLAAAVTHGDLPVFLYGDEDALVDGVPAAPYFRPDWDPVLNLAASYVWHPSVFDRRRALALGAFTDDESEYCQDWDTVFRFWSAGFEPVHVPEVLYHWTAHSASSTHRAQPHQGSLKSQRHVLEEALARLAPDGRFELAPFRLDRGLPELWPRRLHCRPPEVAVAVVGRGARDVDRALQRVARSCDYPVCGYVAQSLESTTDAPPKEIATSGADQGTPQAVRLRHVFGAGVSSLQLAVAAHQSTWTAVIASDCVPEDADWLWEVVGLGELVPDVGFVSGRIIDRDDVVVGGGELWGADEPAWCPDGGYHALDPGPYAMSLKPHSVSAVDPRFFTARTAVLAEALADLPGEADPRWLGVWLGMWAAEHGVRTAYSPLVSARCPRGAASPGAIPDEERRAIVRRFGRLPDEHPLARLYRLTGGRAGSAVS